MPNKPVGGYKYKAEIIDKLHEGLLMGLTVEQACIYAGIHKDTYYDWCKNKPGFKEKMERAALNPFLLAKQTIFRNLNDKETAKWYLEHKSRQEFSLRVETEHSLVEAPVIIDDIPTAKKATKKKE